jgi:hypothetical protein
VFVGVEGGEHDDPRRVALLGQASGRGEPVHPRHADVHQHHVGTCPGDHLKPLGPVASLADDLQVQRTAQHQAEAGPHEWVVVDEHDPDRPAAHRSHGNQAWRRKSPSGVTAS